MHERSSTLGGGLWVALAALLLAPGARAQPLSPSAGPSAPPAAASVPAASAPAPTAPAPAAAVAAPAVAAPAVAAPATQAAAPALERISFAQAVERAMARNPNVAIAAEEIRRAEALVRQSQAQWFPTLTANGTYTRLDSDRVVGGTVFTHQNTETANLNLAMPLFAPARWLATARAGTNVDATRASSEDVRRTIALAAGRAYLAVVASQRQVAVSVRARDNARDHFSYSRSRRLAGVGNRIDEVRAAQQQASSESLLQSNLSALERAQEALGVLLGASVPVDALENADMPGQVPTSVEQAIEDARTRRGDVLAQEARLAIAQHAVRDAWADYMPLITAAFQPFLQYPSTSTLPSSGWQASLVLTLPLYDGGFRYGAQRERRSLEAEAQSGVEATLRQAASEVRAALSEVRLADESLRAARDAAGLASEGLQLANTAYRAGATTNLEVIDAERVARDADSVAATAEDAARQARLDLFAASGHFP